jgi:hypothetical protein
MSEPVKCDRYGRPVTRYELPILKPARQRSSMQIPEQDANNRPISACPNCNRGSFWRFPHSETLWFCINCYPVERGPVLMFCGEVKR